MPPLLLVPALLLGHWALVLATLRLARPGPAAAPPSVALPVWPALAGIFFQTKEPNESLLSAAWIAIAVLVLLSAALEHRFRAAYRERQDQQDLVKSAPPKEAPDVNYSYKMSPVECDEHGRVYGGELLKLIDVSAGLVAAKHAGGPCLTISVDRVCFLQEVRVGDIISISSAVNRAWGSSMEIGVRVVRENRTDPLGPATYCCHAYLTFVARPVPAPEPTFIALKWTDQLGLTNAPGARRAQLAEVKPSTLLGKKRFLLAGRRRAHRLQKAKEHDALHASFRQAVFQLEQDQRAQSDADSRANEPNQERLIASLQLEIVTEAYLRQSPDVRVDGDTVVGEIEGFVEPVRIPRAEVEAAVKRKGHGSWHRIATASDDLVDRVGGQKSHAAWHRIAPADGDQLVGQDGEQGAAMQARSAGVGSHLKFEDTLSMCLWIVRPQHNNSKDLLFGGQLMRWVEEVSTIAARRVCPHASWSSAGIDSLTFKVPVRPGWVVYVRAAVLKVYQSSVEVASIVTCEDRNSPTPEIQHVSESFFTMVAVDPQSGRPLKGALRPVHLPSGPISEMAELAEKRKEDRLLDKRVLQRVYA
ncbi:hypothetical protein JCM8202_000609 [Rhodotorula sphaerocarpa]